MVGAGECADGGSCTAAAAAAIAAADAAAGATGGGAGRSASCACRAAILCCHTLPVLVALAAAARPAVLIALVAVAAAIFVVWCVYVSGTMRAWSEGDAELRTCKKEKVSQVQGCHIIFDILIFFVKLHCCSY